MAYEVEPTPPSEERDNDSSELLSQEWIVEGLVVTTDKHQPQYIVTKVLDGHKKVYPGEYRHHQLRSPNAHFVLSPKDFTKYSYRGLINDEDYYLYAKDDRDLDYLFASDAEVQVGDRIRVVRWSRQKPVEYDVLGGGKSTAWTTEYIENVSVLESDIDIEAEEDRELHRLRYIRENFAGILRRLERLQLEKQERLVGGVASSIKWQSSNEKPGTLFATYVYGEGVVEDHFMRLNAKPYAAEPEMPLDGDMRFTQNGKTFLARDVIGGSPSKELVLASEPQFELVAEVSTETAFNPEVKDLRVDFMIDDVRYTGIVDVEMSTRSFINPGHHLLFRSFSVAGQEYDGIEIPVDDADAILSYQSTMYDLRTRVSRAGIAARRMQQIDYPYPPSSELAPIDTRALAKEIDLISKKAHEDIAPILERVKAMPSDVKLGLGGRLLVPQSKLSSVRVIVG